MSIKIHTYKYLILMLVLAACQPEAPKPETETEGDGPPSTDIWLFSISDDGFNQVARVTDWEGYDNQPMFTEGSDKLLFTSDRSGNSDTYEYDIKAGTITQLSFTDADKYSPTLIPGTDGNQFSVVHSDSLTFQGLWKYARDGALEPTPVVDVDAVAYYTWVGSDDVLFWRLGTTNTLQLINVASADTTVLAEGSVLSLHPIPGQKASAYIFSQEGDATPQIMRFDWATRESTFLAPSIEGGRYFAVTPRGELLMLDGGLLMSYTPHSSTEWTVKADLGLTNGTRLSVSLDGMLLAAVAEKAAE